MSIAIIGMAGRFPGAPTLDEYWQNLRDGVESRTEVTDADLAREGVSLKVKHPRHVRSGFMLADIDMFDSAFFGINPREAEVLDPQHRLFLECAWQALEDAGYDADRFDGTISLYGGSTWCNYLINNLFRSSRLLKSVGHRGLIFGSVPDYMVTRVAYRLNLKGPACFVQTACSTSLVSIHMGCQSLLSGESDMVLAGGVSVKVPHHVGYVYEEGGMESPDGRVRTFDAKAKGTVFGSGVGIVVLKRLDDALRAGDNILAVVRGTASNNDGSVKVGFTAPSVVGQAEVVTQALARAGVSADEIDYIEAHGTGTELGDPIELAALTRAYAAETSRTQYCAVGSVKPNIGHLDAAAGISSIIKTILAIRHGQMPPTINFETLNPKIEIDDSPFFINQTLREWPANGHPRRAGVSSFGFGGTNAHVILEESPARRPTSPSRSHQLLLLSARTPSALETASAQLATQLSRDARTELADVAFTLQRGRRQFASRRAVVCESRADGVPALQGEPSRWVATGQAGSSARRVVFLFPGQGAQYPNMGRGLYEGEPVYRAAVDECARVLEPVMGVDLRQALYPASGAEAAAADQLRRTSVTQAVLFTTELALARLWMHWGIAPAAMGGHSIGEFVAAHLSGVLTLEDALRLVALRGQLMEGMPGGVMAAVPLPEDRVRPLLTEGLWLAAANSPSMCVVSGTEDAVRAFESRLTEQGVEGRRLHTSHAFHSGLMDGAVQAFVDAVAQVRLSAPAIPYVSNVTGGWATEALVCDPAYWGRHIREAVRFGDNVSALAREADTVFLEVGPGNTLSTFVRQGTSLQDGHLALGSLRHPNETLADEAVILHTLGRLWITGAAIDWDAFYDHETRGRVQLPTYPFERTRHWVETDKPTAAGARRARSLMQTDDVTDWFYVPSWRQGTLPSGEEARAPESWLLFVDDGGVGVRLAARLRDAEHRVSMVRGGTSFSADGTDYVINPASEADYEQLIARTREGQRPTRIVHLWGLDGGPEAIGRAETQTRGFYSVLALAKAIGAAGLTSPLGLDVVTSGVYDVTGAEGLVPDKATVLGPCRVIPLEFPNIKCRAIDMLPAELLPERGALDQLLDELLGTTGDADVAYRGGRRWTQAYEPVRIGSASASFEARFRENGTYLITGGLGGIGLVLADDLATGRRINLVLTGRNGLPPRETWDALVAGSDKALSRKIAAVRGLEAKGAQVLVGDADVADLGRMRAVVDEARARFGRIDGVIHSAGVAGGGVIQLKAHAVAAAVLRPKVQGTQVLMQALDGQRPDFVLLCSSLTAVLGGAGQVDYCGANAYLDAFARWHTATTGIHTVAVNWSAWQEVGMAVETDMPESAKGSIRDQMLAVGLSNREGADAFRRIVGAGRHTQIAVSPIDVQVVLDRSRDEQDEASPGSEAAEAVAATARASAHARPALPVAYTEPRTETERRLCGIWQEMLGIAPIGINDNFFDLGGHSLLAVRVMTRVNEMLRTEVPVAKLYEGLTVAFLAQVVDARQSAHAGQAPPKAEDEDLAARRRDKARRREHQQRRLASTRR